MLGRRKVVVEDDVEINMVPIMNLFLVLIPFLLISASFINLKVINSSTPVLSHADESAEKPVVKKVTAVVELTGAGITLSVLSESIATEELEKWNRSLKKVNSEYPLLEMKLILSQIKKNYPNSDTLLLIPEKQVLYNTIIQVMDQARYVDVKTKTPLFVNVVLSGKV